MTNLIDDLPAVCEFFELPTHYSAARILAEEWRDSVIFESFSKGFVSSHKAGQFYRQMAGGWYEKFNTIYGEASRILEAKLTDYFNKRIKQCQTMGDKIKCYKKFQSALICAGMVGFLNNAFAFLAETIKVSGLPTKWNNTPNTLPILDGIADFTGQELIIRHAKPGEYYKNPLPITSAELMAKNDPKAFLLDQQTERQKIKKGRR